MPPCWNANSSNGVPRYLRIKPCKLTNASKSVRLPVCEVRDASAEARLPGASLSKPAIPQCLDIGASLYNGQGHTSKN